MIAPIDYEMRDRNADITLNDSHQAKILDAPASDVISQAWTDLWGDRDSRGGRGVVSPARVYGLIRTTRDGLPTTSP